MSRPAPRTTSWSTAPRLRAEALRQGTTTIEVKSGYGLTVADEARCLHAAFEVSPESTFLGAHVVPPEYAGRADDYVRLALPDASGYDSIVLLNKAATGLSIGYDIPTQTLYDASTADTYIELTSQ